MKEKRVSQGCRCYLWSHGDGHSVGQQVDSLQHEGASVGAELHVFSVGSCEVRSQSPAHRPHLPHDCGKTKHLYRKEENTLSK